MQFRNENILHFMLKFDLLDLFVTVCLILSLIESMREDLMQFSSEDDDDDVFCDGISSTSNQKRKVSNNGKIIDGTSAANQVLASRCISPDNRGELTILERIIRSHPIWYIPELSRVAAAHLLRQHEVGVRNKSLSFFKQL